MSIIDWFCLSFFIFFCFCQLTFPGTWRKRTTVKRKR